METENLTQELSDQDRILLVFGYLGPLALVTLVASRREFVKWHAKQGLALLDLSGAAGLMIWRGALGDPLLFRRLLLRCGTFLGCRTLPCGFRGGLGFGFGLGCGFRFGLGLFHNQDTGKLIADADVTFAVIDTTTGRAVPLEGEIREVFAAPFEDGGA